MLTLREYRKSDIGPLVALANNERVSRYMIDTFPYPYTRKDAEYWIDFAYNADGAITKVIEVNGQYAGSIGLTPQTGWRSHLAEIGYWLGEPYWGKGLATRALVMMCESAFVEHRFRKLYAPVLAPNAASMKVLEKCGFRLIGVLADEVLKRERFFDIHHFERYNPAID